MKIQKKFYTNKIIKNVALCLVCGDIIESTHTHDFNSCSCGNLSVDGGKSYIRRSFGTDNWYELSEVEQVEREPYGYESVTLEDYLEKKFISAIMHGYALGNKHAMSECQDSIYGIALGNKHAMSECQDSIYGMSKEYTEEVMKFISDCTLDNKEKE